MDPLDRLLSEDDSLEPSADFAAAVGRAVREAARAEPLPFPWRRLALGLLACLALASAATPLALRAGAAPWPVALRPLQAAGPALGQAALALIASLLAAGLPRLLARR